MQQYQGFRAYQKIQIVSGGCTGLLNHDKF